MKVEDLIQLAEGDNLNMDAIFATPDIISKLIPIAQVNNTFLHNNIQYNIQILGPKKLMPSTKTGTVSDDLEGAIRVTGYGYLNDSIEISPSSGQL